MKNIRRANGALRARKKIRFSANTGSNILPLLGLAACGSDNGLPSVTAPVIVQVQAPTIMQGQSGATSGNVLPTANQSGAAAATITAVSAQGGSSGTVGQALATSLGTFTLNSNGSYSFVVADTNTVKALAANQTQDVMINFTAQNSVGSTTSSLKFTVTGINDAPIASNDSITAPVIITAPVTGNVLSNDTDIDSGTTLTITNIAVKAAQSGASQSASAQTALSATGVFGSISIQSNGSYTYTVDKSDTDFLALRDGQKATETFTYSVSDGQGGTATAELNIVLTGINEGPQAPQAVKVLDLREYGGFAYIEIGKDAVDYEGDTGFVITALGGKTIEWIGTADDPYAGSPYSGWRYLSQKVTTDYGDFNVSGPDSSSRTIAVPANLNFSVNSNNATLLALKDGEVKEVSVSYTLRDSSGATADASAVIKIIGRDDAPVLKSDIVAPEVSATTPSFTVKLADLIVDFEGAQTTISEISNYSNFSGQTVTTNAGSYTINADTTITYTLNMNSYGYKAATPTTPYYDSVSFRGTDGKQSGYLNLQIKVIGVNDAPVANPVSAQVNFDQTSTTLNSLYNASDPDFGDQLTLSAIAGQALPTATTLTSAAGLLTMTVDGANNLVVAVNRSNTSAANLAYGAQLTDTFSYTVKDTAGATASSTVTVTLTGTKQTPTTGNDIIYLTQLADTFDGLNGNDRFVMLDQRYSPYSSTGYNGAGDTIVGGGGSDTLDFRSGYYSSSQSISVDLTKTTPIKSGDIQQNTIVSGVENVYATSQSDRLFGSVDANILYGYGGNDDLNGLAGNDILIGGADVDTASGGAGDDLIIAENADGGAGNDLLLLLGGYQPVSQLVRGGAGTDTFIVSSDYSASQLTARIADFSHSDGDKIDLSALRDAGGNVLDLQDIIDHSSIVGDSVQIALDTFLSSGSAVRGTLTLDGISSVPALVAGDFIFSSGVDWKALIPSDINGY